MVLLVPLLPLLPPLPGVPERVGAMVGVTRSVAVTALVLVIVAVGVGESASVTVDDEVAVDGAPLISVAVGVGVGVMAGVTPIPPAWVATPASATNNNAAGMAAHARTRRDRRVRGGTGGETGGATGSLVVAPSSTSGIPWRAIRSAARISAALAKRLARSNSMARAITFSTSGETEALATCGGGMELGSEMRRVSEAGTRPDNRWYSVAPSE